MLYTVAKAGSAVQCPDHMCSRTLGHLCAFDWWARSMFLYCLRVSGPPKHVTCTNACFNLGWCQYTAAVALLSHDVLWCDCMVAMVLFYGAICMMTAWCDCMVGKGCCTHSHVSLSDKRNVHTQEKHRQMSTAIIAGSSLQQFWHHKYRKRGSQHYASDPEDKSMFVGIYILVLRKGESQHCNRYFYSLVVYVVVL